MSSEAEHSARPRKDPEPMTLVERPPLAWPMAALIILALSAAGWLMVALVMGWFLR